jgi:hypothetical protein
MKGIWRLLIDYWGILSSNSSAGSLPGLLGSAGFWVDPPGRPGFVGQLPGRFLLRPGPVQGPSQPGPGSTRRAGPGFKTVIPSTFLLSFFFFFFFFYSNLLVVPNDVAWHFIKFNFMIIKIYIHTNDNNWNYEEKRLFLARIHFFACLFLF